MTGSGRKLSWRHRLVLAALALVAGSAFLVGPAVDARAESVEMTMMFHGSVGGKIAPCG